MDATIKNILVPVNFSRTSARAVEAAISLCKEHAADLHLLHVDDWKYNLTADGFLPIYAMAAGKGKDRTADLDLLASFIRHYFHINCYPRLKEGAVAQTIANDAREYQCDLIVIGTERKANKTIYLNDSIPFRLLEHAPCPVLTLPADRKRKSLRRILFPVRLVRNNIQKFNLVDRLTGDGKTYFHILGLFERGNQDDFSGLKKTLSYIKRRVYEENIRFSQALHCYPDPAHRVIEVAKQVSPDLIVITASTRRNLWEFLFGNYTQRILNNTQAAVLCVKEESDASETMMSLCMS